MTERTRIDSRAAWANGRLPLAGLLLVQLVVGYEWLASGLTKLVRGDFPGGLAGELRERSEGAAGWYRSFLDGTVIPNAHAFGYLIEITELVTGVALIAAGLAWLAAWERLPGGGRAAVLLTTAAAALAGVVMAVNFHLANGAGEPWGIPGDSFDEAVDLDSLIVAIQLLLAAVSIGALVSARSRPDREAPVEKQQRTRPPAEFTIERDGGTAGVPERR